MTVIYVYISFFSTLAILQIHILTIKFLPSDVITETVSNLCLGQYMYLFVVLRSRKSLMFLKDTIHVAF